MEASMQWAAYFAQQQYFEEQNRQQWLAYYTQQQQWAAYSSWHQHQHQHQPEPQQYQPEIQQQQLGTQQQRMETQHHRRAGGEKENEKENGKNSWVRRLKKLEEQAEAMRCRMSVGQWRRQQRQQREAAAEEAEAEEVAAEEADAEEPQAEEEAAAIEAAATDQAATDQAAHNREQAATEQAATEEVAAEEAVAEEAEAEEVEANEVPAPLGPAAAAHEAAGEEVAEEAEATAGGGDGGGGNYRIGKRLQQQAAGGEAAAAGQDDGEALAHELGKARKQIAQHARLWRCADQCVKAAEAEAEEQRRCAKVAAQEALRQRARANKMQMCADAAPPVATGFAAGAPVFAHGSRYGFHGAQHVCGAIEADRCAQREHTLAHDNKRLQQELSDSSSELKRWRWDPGAELAANMQCEAVCVQEAEAQIGEAKIQQTEAQRMLSKAHNVQREVLKMHSAAATDRAAAAAARSELEACVDLLCEDM